MVTQFQSNSSDVQQEVCIEPSKFQDGQIPNSITVTYNNRFPYNYKFKRRDENGNYCYGLIVVAGKRKKKKTTPPPPSCICAATLIAEPLLLIAPGPPVTLTYTTSPCAESASITTFPDTGTIPAPPPGGVIVLNPGDDGYPVVGDNTYTLTVVTNTGECTATANVEILS